MLLQSVPLFEPIKTLHNIHGFVAAIKISGFLRWWKKVVDFMELTVRLDNDFRVLNVNVLQNRPCDKLLLPAFNEPS